MGEEMHESLMPRGASRRPLPRQVVLLSWVSFFADVSSEMMYPLLPLFVVGALGAPATALGAIEGTAVATVAILTVLSGWHSDRIRRRVIYIRIGYALPALGKSLLALATVWPVVLAGRAIDRIGKGVRASPRDALIADVVDARMRGRAFGFHRALDTAGALVGVVLSAILFALLVGTGDHAHGSANVDTLRFLFAIAAALGLLSATLTFLVNDPQRRKSSHLTPVSQSSPKSRAETKLRFSRSFWLILALLIVFSLANSSDAFLLLRAADVGLSPLAVILAYAMYNFSYAVASYPAGILSDRVGRWRMIGAGWTIYAIVYAGFAVASAWSIWPLMALYGCYMALTDGVAKALIADHAPPDRRATAMGIVHMSMGLSVLVGSIAAGWLWDHMGADAPFWLGAGGAVLAILLLIALRPLLQEETTRSPAIAPKESV